MYEFGKVFIDREIKESSPIRTDGSVQELSPTTVQENNLAIGGRDELAGFLEGRVLWAPLPELRVGAVVEEQILSRDREPAFAGGRAERLLLGMSVPVRKQVVRIESPTSLPFRYRIEHGSAGRASAAATPTEQPAPPRVRVREQQSPTVRVLELEGGPYPPLEQPEPNLPFDQVPFPVLDYSTGESPWVTHEHGSSGERCKVADHC